MTLKGIPEIIERQIKPWEGPDGRRRYYFNDWDRFFVNGELDRYRIESGIDPTDRIDGIKVFFDEDGRLHINNCFDANLGIVLEHRMEGWYRKAVVDHDCHHSGDCKVLDLISPYCEEFKKGMYRVEHEGKVFIFDQDYMDRLQDCEYVLMDYNNGTYSVCTGFPRLDIILKDIMCAREPIMKDYSNSYSRRRHV